MRSYLFGAALTVLCANGVADARGTEGPMTRVFPLSGFDRVSFSGADNVDVRVGTAESVAVTGDPKIVAQFEAEVLKGELRLKRKGGLRLNGDRTLVRFHVTTPRLVAVSLDGSGKMDVDRAEAPQFTVSLTGSGDVRIASLRADSATISVSGSGDARIAGTASDVTVAVNGSGDADARELRSERARIAVSGSGTIRSAAAQEADVSLDGSGSVFISGGAKCRVSKRGSGFVRCPT